MRLSHLTLSLSIALMFGCTDKEERCDTGEGAYAEPCDYGFGRAADGECYALDCSQGNDGWREAALSECGVSSEPCDGGFGRAHDDICHPLIDTTSDC